MPVAALSLLTLLQSDSVSQHAKLGAPPTKFKATIVRCKSPSKVVAGTKKTLHVHISSVWHVYQECSHRAGVSGDSKAGRV